MISIGYIYKITNNINQKVYIGQTIRDAKARWKQHKQAMNYKNGPQYWNHLYSAMRLYGLENFTFEVIEECNDSILDEREIFWIAKYNSNDLDCGYNNTGGGQAAGKIITRPVAQYDLEGYLLAVYPSISEAARATGGDSGWITEICNGRNALSANSQWRYADDDPPMEFWRRSMDSVCQYDLNGNLVKVHSNSRVAANNTGINHVCILNCLNGHHASAGEYQWRFAHEEPPEKYVNPKLVPVCQYDLFGNYITQFPSVVAAAKSVNPNDVSRTASCISSCCKGRCKISKGFQWRYVGDSPPGKCTNLRGYRRKICQYTLDDEYIATYDNIAAAARSTGIERTSINSCVCGKFKTAGGFIWRRSDETTI